MTIRKLLALLFALALALAVIAACDRGGGTSGSSADGDGTTPTHSPGPTHSPTPVYSPTPTPEQPFEGKIAIITYDVYGNEEDYRSAEAMQRKFGEDKIIHRVRHASRYTEGEQMITILQEIASVPDLKAVIINQAVLNTYTAVDKLLESRPDLFVAYCKPAENLPDVVRRAHLILKPNDQLRGETIIMQAKAMGAKVFIHYSFPRHMEVPDFSQRRNIMMDVCEREGLTFVDLSAPDPMSDIGIPGSSQFTLVDVPNQIAQWGKDTAFFSTSCGMNISLIMMVADLGAIYPEPCCPSPYHGFPYAFGIESTVYDGANVLVNDYGELKDIGHLRVVDEIIDEIRYSVALRGATGRLATWPVSASMMYTAIATEYAIKWINGEVPQEKGNIDYAAIEELCDAYIFAVTGERLGAEINPLSQRGRTYNNCLLFVLDSIVF